MFSVTEIIILTISFAGICYFLWRFKKVSYNAQNLYKAVIVFLLWVSFMVGYGNLMDAYLTEFKSLSVNSQLWIKILIAGLTGGVYGYSGNLIHKYIENRRVSDYLNKASKTQKFHRKGKK